MALKYGARIIHLTDILLQLLCYKIVPGTCVLLFLTCKNLLVFMSFIIIWGKVTHICVNEQLSLVHKMPCCRVGAKPLSTKRLPGLHLNIESVFLSYGDSHVKYKKVTGPSYFNMGDTILIRRYFVLKRPSVALLTCKHRWKYYLVSIRHYAPATVQTISYILSTAFIIGGQFENAHFEHVHQGNAYDNIFYLQYL